VSWSVTKIDSQHFTVTVDGMKIDGSADGNVSVYVRAGVVKDAAGVSNSASQPATIIWAAAGLTITASPPTGFNVNLSGTAGHLQGDALTVTAVVCPTKNFPCVSPEETDAVAVDPVTGRWQVTTNSLGSGTHWAQVTQDQAGTMVAATTGPFTT
jgi:hypothetical protein